MPRGGARQNSGGKRANAGRKKGAATKRTRKTNIIAEKAAGEGAQPLQVMLEAMRKHHADGNLDKAAAIAKDAAPYVHTKAPTHHKLEGDVIVKSLEYVIIDSVEASQAANPSAPGAS